MPFSTSLRFLCVLLTGILLLTVSTVFGQSVRGSVVDSKNEPLIGVTLRLISLPDSSVQRGEVTDTDGRFRFNDLGVGSYQLRASFVGFTSTVANRSG